MKKIRIFIDFFVFIICILLFTTVVLAQNTGNTVRTRVGSPAEDTALTSDWPLKADSGCSITQVPYVAAPTHGSLNAVDIGAPHGTPLYATMDGTATVTVFLSSCPAGCPPNGLGTNVKITSGSSWAIYAHLIGSSVSHLTSGQTVKKGDKIGEVDNTGYSTGSHVHYELSPGSKFPDFSTACK